MTYEEAAEKARKQGGTLTWTKAGEWDVISTPTTSAEWWESRPGFKMPWQTPAGEGFIAPRCGGSDARYDRIQGCW